MDDRVVEFSNLLRRNGLRVALSETIEALSALDLVGVADGPVFKDALRSVLVKRSIDIETFNQLFDTYFYGLSTFIKGFERDLIEALGGDPEELQSLLEEIQRRLDDREYPLSELTRALLSGNLIQVENLLRTAAQRLRTEERQGRRDAESYVQLLMSYVQISRVEEELQGFGRLVQDSDGTEYRDRIQLYVNQRFRNLIEMVRRLVNLELKKGELSSSDRDSLETLSEKSFAYYTEDDVRKMNEVVTHMARHFKNLLSVRRRKARKDRFDVKGTSRKNLQYGGVPFHIQFHGRRREKPQIIVLCDISDSVLNAARFMLQFLYSVQELYVKVRSFVFVSDIGEVTQLFEENEIHQAVDKALKGEVINVFTHSNFGEAFEMFHAKYLSAVTGKTTLIIMGDGRNNYHRPNQWALKELQQRAKQVIWLNPESRLTWGVGDSEMPRYAPYCDLSEECRNIDQLYRVIGRLAS